MDQEEAKQPHPANKDKEAFAGSEMTFLLETTRCILGGICFWPTSTTPKKQFEHWEKNIFIVLLQAIYISNNVGMGWFFALVILRSRYYEKLSR